MRSHVSDPRANCVSIGILFIIVSLFLPVNVTAAQPGFRFSYLPTSNVIRHVILSPPADAKTWRLALEKIGENRVMTEQSGKFPFPATGETMRIPKLDNGTYRLTLVINGSGRDPEVLERTFTREIRPWEGNNLGKDRTVIIPPFTPLTVDEKTGRVGCILRGYQMSGAGLWNQVTSEGENLLDAPMTLRVESGGKTYSAAGARPVFTKKEGYQVVGSSTWSAGPVSGATRFDYDYDGMMKVTLEIKPSSAMVDRMSLDIPLRAEEAWLMHPVTDLLRDHYAGKIPDGQGKVWDSANVARYALPGPFVPYIWVGGPERGVCWFADNDKDWITDGVTPALEIRRTGKTVALEIRFITKPSTLTRARTITFGLMATPAKPMPETPRPWRNWWEQVTLSDKTDYNIQFIGSCYYFGAQTPFNQYYPAFENYSIFDEFAQVKKTGQIDPDFITKKWMPQFDASPLFTRDMKTTFVNHVNYTLQRLQDNWKKRQTDKDNLLCLMMYTNARGVVWDEDTRNFMDEWTIYDIADPRWSAADDFPRFLREYAAKYTMLDCFNYESDPVDSYADMALFYEQRMYKTFMDGVYYDDCFFHANYNPVPGPGYVGDDGKLHPGVGFFAMRDFIRRTAVMQYQMGMRPMVYLHMTNANLVPVLSFGTMNLDWEWRDQGDYAVKDLQDRLDVDKDASLIFAQSTGLQSGNVTVSIDRFHPPKDSGVSREWLIRTNLAVSIPHEIKPAGADDVILNTIRILTDFGYGAKDCSVYRYWDSPFPIITSGANVKPLLLIRGGKALVFFGSFGEGGDCTVKLNPRKLGLPKSLQAKDGETGEALKSAGPGVFIVPIKKHDFRIVVME